MAERLGMCLGCSEIQPELFLDLGLTPLANSYPAVEDLSSPEPRFRLAVAYCPRCNLVQLTDTVPPGDIYGEYLYFSSYSESFLRHAAEMARTLKDRFGLGPDSFVVEIASNDGYLLKNFVSSGIPVLGVEPAANIARVAEAGGVPTLVDFFGEDSARRIRDERGAADVIIGNNVLAHAPRINDFLSGVNVCLKDEGIAVFEVPWLHELIRKVEFDTIYHEHVFY
jgi:SAM-dependent methyltransferase